MNKSNRLLAAEEQQRASGESAESDRRGLGDRTTATGELEARQTFEVSRNCRGLCSGITEGNSELRRLTRGCTFGECCFIGRATSGSPCAHLEDSSCATRDTRNFHFATGEISVDLEGNCGTYSGKAPSSGPSIQLSQVVCTCQLSSIDVQYWSINPSGRNFVSKVDGTLSQCTNRSYDTCCNKQ